MNFHLLLNNEILQLIVQQRKPIDAFEKSSKKVVFCNIQDQPKIKLGQLVRTGDIKKVFSKGGSTNWSYKFYSITQIIHDPIPSYRIDYLPKRYKENLLRSTKLNLEENNQVLKKLNITQ